VPKPNELSEDSHPSVSGTAGVKDTSIIGTQLSAQWRSTQANSQPYADIIRSRLVEREALSLLERITGTRHLDRLLPAIKEQLRSEDCQACLDGFNEEKTATDSYTAVTWLEQLSALVFSFFFFFFFPLVDRPACADALVLISSATSSAKRPRRKQLG
jgi:hypothetical protein